MYVSATLNCVGSWIRYVAKHNYALTTVGALVTAMAQLWSLPAPALITDRWFPPQERTMVVSLSIGMNVLGLSFGYFASAVIVGNTSDNVGQMLFWYAVWMTVPLLLVFPFMRERPANSPNFSQQAPQQGFKESMSMLFINLRNCTNLLWIAMFIGFTWCYQNLISEILQPLHLDVLDNGYIGLVMNLSGAIASVIASYRMENALMLGQTPNYDLYIKFFNFGSYLISILLTVVFVLGLQPPLPVIYLMCGLIGLGQNAAVPFIAQAFLEDAYPVNGTMALNAVLYFPQAATFALNLLTTQGLWIINTIMLPFMLGVLFFYKTILRRHQAEKLFVDNNFESQNWFTSQIIEKETLSKLPPSRFLHDDPPSAANQ